MCVFNTHVETGHNSQETHTHKISYGYHMMQRGIIYQMLFTKLDYLKLKYCQNYYRLHLVNRANSKIRNIDNILKFGNTISMSAHILPKNRQSRDK